MTMNELLNNHLLWFIPLFVLASFFSGYCIGSIDMYQKVMNILFKDE